MGPFGLLYIYICIYESTFFNLFLLDLKGSVFQISRDLTGMCIYLCRFFTGLFSSFGSSYQ